MAEGAALGGAELLPVWKWKNPAWLEGRSRRNSQGDMDIVQEGPECVNGKSTPISFQPKSAQPRRVMAPSDILLDWSPPWGSSTHEDATRTHTCPSRGTPSSSPVGFQEQVNIPQGAPESFKSGVTLPQEPSPSTKQFPGGFSGEGITDTGGFLVFAWLFPTLQPPGCLLAVLTFRSVFMPLFLRTPYSSDFPMILLVGVFRKLERDGSVQPLASSSPAEFNPTAVIISLITISLLPCKEEGCKNPIFFKGRCGLEIIG